MNIQATTITISIIAVIVLIFYIPLLSLALTSTTKREARVKFYRALLTILERNQDDQQCVPQIFVAFKKTSERYSGIQNSYRSAVDLVEDFIFRADSITPDRFKDIYKMEVSMDNRKRITNITNLMKQSEPFASVSSKFNGLFNMLNHALNTNNKDLGKSMLDQMADDVEILERKVSSQQRTNIAAIVVSIVGVILTLVFGIITIAPLIFTGK